MSRETLHLMLKLNPEDLDTQVALQCAPLLTGMKISNLLTVGRSKRAAVLELFKETAVSCCILYESSEKTTFLLYIRQALETYLDRPEVNGIMHTHSTYALTVAAARKSIPPICDDQVQILGGDVRLAAYTMPGTKEMAKAVVQALKGRAGALIANHGAITVGRTLPEAYVGSQVLEKAAIVYINMNIAMDSDRIDVHML